MEQGGFDWATPAVDPSRVSPTGVPRPPINGSTMMTRHASATGAAAIAETYPARVSAYLQLLNQSGGLNDFEAAALLKWGGVNSVNSVRGWLRQNRPGLIVEDGFDEHAFVDAGGTERTTRRTRFRVNRRPEGTNP